MGPSSENEPITRNQRNNIISGSFIKAQPRLNEQDSFKDIRNYRDLENIATMSGPQVLMNRNRVGSLANSFMTDNSEFIDERLIQHQ